MFERLLRRLLGRLQSEKMAQHKRRVPLGDLLTDRWQNARAYGFGEGVSCYDSVLIIGDVKVGKNTWIGPNVVLDGSGGLEIGENCTIGAGAQIYSHDSVKWALSGGDAAYERAPTHIGNHCFIGPNAVIAKGLVVGDGAAIGALTFVNRDVPAGGKIVASSPRLIGVPGTEGRAVA